MRHRWWTRYAAATASKICVYPLGSLYLCWYLTVWLLKLKACCVRLTESKVCVAVNYYSSACAKYISTSPPTELYVTLRNYECGGPAGTDGLRLFSTDGYSAQCGLQASTLSVNVAMNSSPWKIYVCVNVRFTCCFFVANKIMISWRGPHNW